MLGQWQPDAELRELFQQIGREEHGDALEEVWTASLRDDGIVYGDEMFTTFMFDDDPGYIARR